MTRAFDLAACILSGQVPDEAVPSLVRDTPGLAAELERRSSAMSPALAVEAGRGDSISSPGALRPANPVHFRSEGALAHRLGEEEGRRPVQTRGLVSKFIGSFHPPSFLGKLWSK
ncbi:MAG: hypothetical protein IPK75_12665 [Acidobacteria bacterium]|nr:hypothetical protein [Acidobacteriota bacterium]